MHTIATVFAIDDEAAILESLKYVVQSLGYAYEPYSSAGEFWQARDVEKFGCLILDMSMPGQSGEELFDRLCASGRTWPTIVITGHGELALGVRMVKKGVLDFLEKPFSAEKLRTLIQQAIEMDRGHRLQENGRKRLRISMGTLSDDQMAILRELRKGASSREIAERLDLSLRTVQTRRSQIANKLGVEGKSGWNKLIVSLGDLEC